MPTLTIRVRLLLLTSILTCLIFAGTIGFIAWYSRNMTEENTLDHAQTLAAKESASIASDFRQAFATIETLNHSISALIAAKMPPSREQINHMLAQTLSHTPNVIGMGTLWEANALDGKDDEYRNKAPAHDATGRFLPYWYRDNGNLRVEALVDYDNPKTNSWYRLPKTTLRPIFTEPYDYPVGGKTIQMVTLSTPVQVNGQFQAVITLDYPLTALHDYLGKLHPFGQGQVSLISAEGVYASHPEQARIGKPAQLPAEAMTALRQGQLYRFGTADTAYVIAPLIVHEKMAPWAVLVSIPHSTVMASANHMVWLTISCASGGLLLLIITLALGIRRALNPLTSMSDAIGHLDNNLTTRFEERKRDEVGQIATAFNQFLQRLQQLVRLIRTQRDQVAQHSHALVNLTEQIAERSTQQSDASMATAATMEEISTAIEHIANHAQQAKSTTVDTHTLLDEALSHINAMTQDMQRLHDNMGEVKQQVQGLEQQATQIDKITVIIKDIAEQTNLLALNAAIEAARAGEQGRGFAVVADEVRTLAERTGKATEEIAQVLCNIQQDSTQVSNAVDEASHRIADRSQQAQDTLQRVQTIQQHIADVGEQTLAIAAATDQQAQASHEVSRHLATISSMAQENDQAVQTARHTVTTLANAVNGLGQQVGAFQI